MIYKFFSTDTGAPTVSGTVGHLINVLDACLVDGYNSVSVSSMTRSGSVVTVTTSSPHGFVMYGASTPTGPIAQISGANEAGYNGKWEVASVTSTTVFTFNIGAATPASPATGTITSKRAPVGWTKAFSGTNKAAYRLPIGSTRHYLRVDDNSPSAGDARCAAMRGYETMLDIDNGSGLFPTLVQQPNGRALAKSDTLSTATRPWALLADDYCFWWLPDYAANSLSAINFFGDFPSYRPGDAFNTAFNGGTVVAGANITSTSWAVTNQSLTTVSNSYTLARSFTGLGSAINSSWIGDGPSASMGANGMTGPAPHDNGLYVAKCRVVDGSVTNGIMRGEWPGILQPLHNGRFLPHMSTVEDVVGMSGRVLMPFNVRDGNTTSSYWTLFDLTGPWR